MEIIAKLFCSVVPRCADLLPAQLTEQLNTVLTPQVLGLIGLAVILAIMIRALLSNGIFTSLLAGFVLAGVVVGGATLLAPPDHSKPSVFAARLAPVNGQASPLMAELAKRVPALPVRATAKIKDGVTLDDLRAAFESSDIRAEKIEPTEQSAQMVIRAQAHIAQQSESVVASLAAFEQTYKKSRADYVAKMDTLGEQADNAPTFSERLALESAYADQGRGLDRIDALAGPKVGAIQLRAGAGAVLKLAQNVDVFQQVVPDDVGPNFRLVTSGLRPAVALTPQQFMVGALLAVIGGLFALALLGARFAGIARWVVILPIAIMALVASTVMWTTSKSEPVAQFGWPFAFVQQQSTNDSEVPLAGAPVRFSLAAVPAAIFAPEPMVKTIGAWALGLALLALVGGLRRRDGSRPLRSHWLDQTEPAPG